MTGRVKAVVAGALATAAAASAAVAFAGGGPPAFEERLTGYQEDPMALSTTGAGAFKAAIGESGDRIAYRLAYRDLEGAVTQAHIHLGGRHQSGGIIAFLCSNLGNGPEGTQACPPAPEKGWATVSGTLGPADVVGPEGQGIAPGEFAELVAAMRAGVTYVNVHSDTYPSGEIRAQLRHRRG